MEKRTRNIFLMSGIGLLIFGLGYLILKKSKKLKGKGEVSAETKKQNKIVFVKNK